MLGAEVRLDGFGDGRFEAVNTAQFELEMRTQSYERDFLPKHGEGQYMCPPSLLSSSVFAVRSKAQARAPSVKVNVLAGTRGTYSYEGPELRQSDLRALLSLFNCARDYRLGVPVSVPVGEFCRAVLGSSGGSARTRLEVILDRLGRGGVLCPDGNLVALVVSPAVQSGHVDFALDRGLASLFEGRGVWLDRSIHNRLSAGLASWCYGMSRSYATLIPWPLARLQAACGASGSAASFRDLVVRAMPELVAAGVIDSGWSISRDTLRWRKARDGQPLAEGLAPITDEARTPRNTRTHK
jgi:hypothetical protein